MELKRGGGQRFGLAGLRVTCERDTPVPAGRLATGALRGRYWTIRFPFMPAVKWPGKVHTYG